ncbi:hypothetical protein PENTCL1PPCAC_11207 [Pristionchus entomophagus]|uniref:Apoptosis regulator Bcl-2 family BH4 domain-containing protein n=1 Tax=Pristionchus entomophagus TaxID=358040 RepID=A0AAV5T218_9BILA|nr:hypothetical protein PENTCL1PPCAC_11207 [Pristionchus entomophagus]
MAVQYEHDWEDPRLSVEGFVTDYIVWRLAKDGLEWREAPDVPEDADREHEAMRTMGEIFEKRNGKELLELSEDLESDTLHFARYCEVVEQFGKNDTDIPSEMTYGRMVGLIAFAGLVCVEKAKEDKRRDMGLIALYTSRFIDKNIRLTWIDSMRSWAKFMDMAVQVVARHSRSSLQSRIAPRSTVDSVPVPVSHPTPSSSSSSSSRRSSLLFVAGAAASIVGVCVVGRMLIRSH